ncbi:hypothetical protein [Nostoc sphaeroides]|uniref:Uncharacterized protein n=1 Tax=Nostoc sphaeroides CCNUC1 TaxID=2653204 RepID=A0A5P8WD77_9NOSO|nr:hypothetical protein [Nostoc sphaeroides]QFS50512.1 hypothetical protein GXM_08006 [Nostoc sphaeroides CCNUC1]
MSAFLSFSATPNYKKFLDDAAHLPPRFDSTYKNSDRSEASTALKVLIPVMLMEYSL